MKKSRLILKTVRCVIIFCIIMLMTACSKKIDENTVPDSIVGKWIEDRLYEYVFDKDGNVTVSAEWFELNGTYTVEGNELQITMEYNGSYKQPCSFRFLMTAEAGRYKLEREYDKDTDGKYIPYEPAGLASGFLSAFSDEGVCYLNLPYEEPSPVLHQKDVVGSWLDEDRLMVVEDDCIYFCSDVYILKSSKYIEDGKILSYEETSVGEDIPDKYLKFYKGELYQTYYIYAPFMWKKYEAVPITDISGKYEVYIDSEDDCSYEMNLENSKGKMSSVISAEEKINEDEIDVEIVINDGIYTFICGEDTKEFTYGVCFNECFYFHSESGTMVLKNTQAERTNQNEAS